LIWLVLGTDTVVGNVGRYQENSMMTRNLTKAIGAGVLSLSMAMLPLTLPAKAQVGEPGTTPGTTQPGVETTPRTVVREEGGFDWGWLGLIGLFGLAGLAGKKRSEEPTRYRDPSTPGATTYRD
jgi:hypothetical protein